MFIVVYVMEFRKGIGLQNFPDLSRKDTSNICIFNPCLCFAFGYTLSNFLQFPKGILSFWIKFHHHYAKTFFWYFSIYYYHDMVQCTCFPGIPTTVPIILSFESTSRLSWYKSNNYRFLDAVNPWTHIFMQLPLLFLDVSYATPLSGFSVGGSMVLNGFASTSYQSMCSWSWLMDFIPLVKKFICLDRCLTYYTLLKARSVVLPDCLNWMALVLEEDS